jgi:hypothetical protein
MKGESFDPIEIEIRKFLKRCDRIIHNHQNQGEYHCLGEIESKEKRRNEAEKDLNSLDT